MAKLQTFRNFPSSLSTLTFVPATLSDFSNDRRPKFKTLTPLSLENVIKLREKRGTLHIFFSYCLVVYAYNLRWLNPYVLHSTILSNVDRRLKFKSLRTY